MSHKFDPGLEQKLSTWLEDNVGLEFFKGGFERLGEHYQSFKDQFQKKNIKIVTVGGTNGKGQTCHFLEEGLVSSGKKVALWTSPHIFSVTERFRLNGIPISQSELLDEFEELGKVGGKTELSYYEFLFHTFLSWVSKQDAEVLIFEVGLGGRLDAVNFFDPDLTALVSIGRDHQEILGSSLKEILSEKMGICRTNVHLVSTVEQTFLQKIMTTETENKSIPFINLHEKGWVSEDSPYEISNALLAKVLEETVLAGAFSGQKPELSGGPLSEFKGRCEKMTLDAVRFIFIGAHNVDGMRKLTQSVVKQQSQYGLDSNSILWLSFSSRTDEEIETMFDIWQASKCLYREIWVSPFDHPKAFDKDRLIKLVEKRNKGNIHLVLDWKERIRNLQSKESILVSGSYYFIGAIQRELLELGGEGSLSV